MDIWKLIIIFLSILAAMRMKKPLYLSMSFGILMTLLLYKIRIVDSLHLIFKGATGESTINLVLAFYSITFLQRMLEKRDHLLLAEESLSNIFNNRRIIAMIAPFIIGLLPSAGAVLIAGPIVDNVSADYVTKEEKTFITTYFRHISELFLPTYASILLAINLSGVNMTSFVIAMMPMVMVLFFLGYIFYIRKIPKETGYKRSGNKINDIKNLIRSLWTIAITIVIILSFNMSVYISVIPVIILSFILNRFTFTEIKPMFKSAIETKLIISTIIIMIFKEILTFTGVIERLPHYFEVLPVPPTIIFAFIFFFGTLVAGSQAIIAIALPLAFATIPNGGLALMVLLMSMTYIAMQISPTHICLLIVTEAFGTSFIDLIKKTIPILILYAIISSAYSYLLFLL